MRPIPEWKEITSALLKCKCGQVPMTGIKLDCCVYVGGFGGVGGGARARRIISHSVCELLINPFAASVLFLNRNGNLENRRSGNVAPNSINWRETQREKRPTILFVRRHKQLRRKRVAVSNLRGRRREWNGGRRRVAE